MADGVSAVGLVLFHSSRGSRARCDGGTPRCL